MKKKKVLFVCTHNSARSHMVEGLLRDMFGDRYEAYSAGTEPTTLNPYAIKVMAEIGIDISKHRTKSINEFSRSKFDIVITVCDQAKSICPFFPDAKKNIHQSFQDPSVLTGTEDEILLSVRRIRVQIKEWIEINL
jgi:arsenate reductase